MLYSYLALFFFTFGVQGIGISNSKFFFLSFLFYICVFFICRLFFFHFVCFLYIYKYLFYTHTHTVVVRIVFFLTGYYIIIVVVVTFDFSFSFLFFLVCMLGPVASFFVVVVHCNILHVNSGREENKHSNGYDDFLD